jgi:two-component system response regulator RegX3
LLDINLSDGSGFELCKKIRQTLNIPILFISARNTDDDKIIALNIGGDDYIEKPYSLGVLLAKVKVVLKRFSNVSDTDNSKKEGFNDGYLKLDPVNKTVFVNGEEKKITSIELKLLEYLIENKNRLVTKNEIFDKVWNDKFTTDGTLNVHIRKIREAIEKEPQDPKYIVTVWKEGYKFVAGDENK